MFEAYIVDSDRYVTVRKSAAELRKIAAGYNSRVTEFSRTADEGADPITQARWAKKHDRMLNNAMRLMGLVWEASRLAH